MPRFAYPRGSFAPGSDVSTNDQLGDSDPRKNLLLARLNADDYKTLMRVAKVVPLKFRKQIYRQAERLALDDAALVGLAWRSQGYAMQKSVKGFKNMPGFLTFYSGLTLEDTEAV